MKNIFLAAVVMLAVASLALADKGPVLWQKDVTLIQESQKAIILHNGVEEMLILGTELKASAEIDLLEFIPFPSEPKVSLAQGDPFQAVSRLIAEKGLVFLTDDAPVKGGAGSAATAPVEIRFSEKIGLHDVTVVKVNDVKEFDRWLEGFFKARGIEADREKLAGVTGNARDYIGRGYTYFVFDHVKVLRMTRFVEPLVYRFRADRVYYPLKTSNLIGSRGTVEMVFILPGSVTDKIWQDARNIFDMAAGGAVELSSSSKACRKDIMPICPDKDFFGPRSKIYVQVLRYTGPYAFRDDFTYSTGLLVPYAYRFGSSPWHGGHKEFTPSFTPEEMRDLKEVLCPKSGDFRYIFEITDYGLDCSGYVPTEEYEVYAAVFRERIPGIPSGRVELQKSTTRKQVGSKKIEVGKDLIKDFNGKNAASYMLENAFPDDGVCMVTVGGDPGAKLSPAGGKTSVSRVGFNRDGSRALVHVDHIAGPRSGAAYYVILSKKGGKWKIINSVLEAVY